jgi:hypothetical protein
MSSLKSLLIYLLAQVASIAFVCTYLERDQQGPILYRKAHNLRFGAGYNTHVARPSLPLRRIQVTPLAFAARLDLRARE